jgi:hypothetical protein
VFIGGEGHGVVMGVSLHVSESSPEEEDMMRVLMILIWLTLCKVRTRREEDHGSRCCLFIDVERRREWDGG